MRRRLRGIGITLLVAGGLLLTFVAYQLWGTSLSEHSAQGRLRTELEGQLHHRSSPVTTPATDTHASGTGGPDTIGGSAPSTTGGQPADGQPIGFLTIPRIGMANDVIIQGTQDGDLRQGPGHYSDTPLPGQAGNVAIAGHRTTYAAPFYNLDELQTGDPIVIKTVDGTFHYAVTQNRVVAPSDTAVLDDSAGAELTLTTCNPRYSADQRLVVVAVLESSEPASAPVVHRASGPEKQTKAAKAVAATSALGGSVGGGGSGIVGVVLWGLLTVAIAGLAAVLWRRPRRPMPRWVTALVGGPGILIALFLFYGHLSTLLPASF